LGAYALPHLIHGYISKERKNSGHRFNEWTELLEMLLAWHILCWTTLTLVWTEITNWRNLLRRRSPVKPPAFKWKAVLPYLALFVLNLAALTSGVTDLVTSPRPIEEMTVLFVVWAIYNVMFFTAMLAVAEESRQIRLHTSMQRHLPAMVRLPSGRTVSCTTENFPERSLALQLPMPVAIESEMTVSISIFHNNHEFSFPARVALAQDLLLRVEINGPAQNVYNALAVAAYSRGQDWPKWLPARDADHPLPKWLAPALATLRHRAFRRVTDFGKLMGRQLNRVRMQIGKKK
jgi:cellulose synthase (UDP-forming)